jgi:homocysteine S-methyltransferase
MLQELLHRQGFVILDGGLASELERHGANLDDPLWSGKALLQTPELVEQVTYSYYEAGADVAVSASYQLTLPGLLAKGYTRAEAESTLRQSVALVRQAAARANRERLLAAASIGPYGAYLHNGSEYRGDYTLTRRQFQDFHRERLAILIACQPDVVAFETIPNALEAQALAELLTEFPGVTAWLSFSCHDEKHLSDGTPLREAIAAVADNPQIAAIGVNCTAPHLVSQLLEQAAGATTKPLVAYPNSGECYLPETKTWGHTSELETISAAAADWYRRGARLIGGCCRTTPDTIRAIRAAVTRAAVC